MAIAAAILASTISACEPDGLQESIPGWVPSRGPSSVLAEPSLDPNFVRHVRIDGDDNADGSASRPWRTLQHAVDAAQPGMTIFVADGTYAGFTVERSGEPGRPIIIASEPGAAPVIEDAARQYLVHVAASNIMLKALHIRGATVQEGAGIYVAPGSRHIIIRDSEVAENVSFGVLIEDASDVVIEGNDIHGSASGVRTRGAVPGTVIRNNDIHDNDRMVVNDPEPNNDTGGQAVAISLSSGPVTIADNRIWGNRATSHDYGEDGSAFEIFGSTNVEITGNVVWDNETVMETGTTRTAECVDIIFVRNVAVGDASWGEAKGMLLRCARDSLVAHNTLVELDEWVLQFRNRDFGFAGSIENLTVVNNIISGPIGFYIVDPLPASVTIDHNLVDVTGTLAEVYGEDVTTLTELRSHVGIQESGRHATLGLVDAAARDLRLLSTSPAVDAGVLIAGVNDDYSGVAPDIGRYELE